MILGTENRNATRLRVTGETTATTIAARPPTGTTPADLGVITFAQISPNNIKIFPFGAGNADQTFLIRVLGWKPTSQETTALWVPMTLFEGTCTLSTAVGVAAKDVVNTERFVDTITAHADFSALANISYQIVSRANNTPAHILIDLQGAKLGEVLFAMVDATSGNCLYSAL